MSKGVVIAVIFFILGFSLQFVPLPAEARVATTDTAVESAQRIPFEAIKVYKDYVSIDVSDLRYARVKSNSMAPIITDKSVVFERVPGSADEIIVGDVISFYEPSEDDYVLHAVIEVLDTKEGVYFRTKGLANPEPDPWIVPYSNVKGIMVGTLR